MRVTKKRIQKLFLKNFKNNCTWGVGLPAMTVFLFFIAGENFFHSCYKNCRPVILEYLTISSKIIFGPRAKKIAAIYNFMNNIDF